MFPTIKGTYDGEKIVLNEKPPVTTTTEVIVTFLTGGETKKEPAKRKIGGLEGKVRIPENFNEPLEDLKDYM